MNSKFWLGKRVFLTGHTGFKGSWLSLWLQSLGAHVTGYALKPLTNPSLFKVASVARGMISLEGDIRDLAHFRESMQTTQPEVVIHMAAQPLVRQSYQDPVETYSTNVMGTVNLFEAVRVTPSIKAVVNVTTDKCYENREWVWGYRENDPMGGYDPYSSSKGCAELVTAAYRSSFFNSQDYARHGVAVASARAGNVIGGGDRSKDRIIPDIVKSVETGNKLYIRNPYSIRPWQHVLESVYGYLLLGAKLKSDINFGTAWNFGPNQKDALTVHNIVQLAKAKWGDLDVVYESDKNDLHEAKTLKLDISKTLLELNWQPRWDSSKAIEQTFDWYEKSKEQDPQELVFQQIEDYLNS